MHVASGQSYCRVRLFLGDGAACPPRPLCPPSQVPVLPSLGIGPSFLFALSFRRGDARHSRRSPPGLRNAHRVYEDTIGIGAPVFWL